MQEFIKKIKVYSFLNHLIFIYPVYAIMFKDNGLDTSQIGSLLAVWAFVAFLLEIPFGIIADKFSRKWVLIFGSILKFLVFIIWFFIPVYWGFLIGFIIWGASGALISGTFEAFIYDELVKYKQAGKYQSLMGEISSLKNIGVAIALVLGGALSEIGYWVVLWLSSASCGIGIIILLQIKPARIVKTTGETDMLEQIKKIVPQIINTKSLLTLTVTFILFMSAYGALDEFYPLFYNDLGVPKGYMGILGFLGYSFASLGGWLISKKSIEKKFSTNYALLSGVFCYGGYYFTQNIWFIVLHFPLAAIFVMAEVQLQANMQKHFESSVRATSLSVINMLKELLVVGMTALMGFVAVNGLWKVFGVAGGVVLIAWVASALGNMKKNWKSY
jgi:MFS family permease